MINCLSAWRWCGFRVVLLHVRSKRLSGCSLLTHRTILYLPALCTAPYNKNNSATAGKILLKDSFFTTNQKFILLLTGEFIQRITLGFQELWIMEIS